MRKIITIIATMLCATVFGQSSEFTYQGQLEQGGSAADGEFDFQFALFDSEDFVSGVVFAGPITLDNVSVSNGNLVATLDFGPGVFGSMDLYLEIRVREGESDGPFTTLAPRQKVTPVPLAQHAFEVEPGAIGAAQIVSGSIGTTQLADAGVGADDVDSSAIQLRIGGTCAPGSSIRSIGNSGQVICENDDGTDLSNQLCPPEQMVVGFLGDGSPRCVASLGECPVSTSVQLSTVARVDFVLVMDNSGSMAGEIAAVEGSINAMAATLDGLGTDYRFVALTDHGNEALELCVSPPLGGTTNCLLPAVSGPRFFHYDLAIGSQTSLCNVLDAYSGADPDETGAFGSGYQTLLRPDSFKAFIEVTDDGVNCTSSETGFSFNDVNSVAGGETVATNFATALGVLSEEQFGASGDDRYAWFGLIGVPENGSTTTPYTATDDITTNTCLTAVDPGTGYQALAKNTDGLWFSQCATADYGSMLNQIAVQADSRASPAGTCTIPIPVPGGRTLDPGQATVTFSPNGSSPVELSRVSDAGSCAGNDYYLSGDNVVLCPATCAAAQADAVGQIDVSASCTWPP